MEILNKKISETPPASPGRPSEEYRMKFITTLAVTFFAGMGAGLGTGFAGMSAAAVISPMLITFLGMDPYMAVGIALASDVLASAVSAYTYHKKQEPGYPERHHYDGHRASVHRGRQLHRQPGALPHHGKLLRDHDVPAGRQVHRPSRYDHQGGHAGCLRQKSVPSSLWSAASSLASSVASWAQAAA